MVSTTTYQELETVMKNCENFNEFMKYGYDTLLDYLEGANGVSRVEMFADDVNEQARELWDEHVYATLPF